MAATRLALRFSGMEGLESVTEAKLAAYKWKTRETVFTELLSAALDDGGASIRSLTARHAEAVKGKPKADVAALNAPYREAFAKLARPHAPPPLPLSRPHPQVCRKAKDLALKFGDAPPRASRDPASVVDERRRAEALQLMEWLLCRGARPAVAVPPPPQRPPGTAGGGRRGVASARARGRPAGALPRAASPPRGEGGAGDGGGQAGELAALRRMHEALAQEVDGECLDRRRLHMLKCANMQLERQVLLLTAALEARVAAAAGLRAALDGAKEAMAGLASAPRAPAPAGGSQLVLDAATAEGVAELLARAEAAERSVAADTRADEAMRLPPAIATRRYGGDGPHDTLLALCKGELQPAALDALHGKLAEAHAALVALPQSVAAATAAIVREAGNEVADILTMFPSAAPRAPLREASGALILPTPDELEAAIGSLRGASPAVRSVLRCADVPRAEAQARGSARPSPVY